MEYVLYVCMLFQTFVQNLRKSIVVVEFDRQDANLNQMLRRGCLFVVMKLRVESQYMLRHEIMPC